MEHTQLLMAAITSALGWLLWSVLVGAIANRLPSGWLARDHWFWRRPWHEQARTFEGRLAIRRWKRDPRNLERLLLETKRAEWVHLVLWLFWLVTPLWLPPAGVLINLAFATLFNLPCLWVQRYNRLRLQQLLARP